MTIYAALIVEVFENGCTSVESRTEHVFFTTNCVNKGDKKWTNNLMRLENQSFKN